MIKSYQKMGLTNMLLNYQGILFSKVIVKYVAWFLYSKLHVYIFYCFQTNREDFYIASHIMWGKRFVWEVHCFTVFFHMGKTTSVLFHTTISSSTPNFAILSLTPYTHVLIRLHASFIKDTLLDLPCGTTWQLCPGPRASVRNSALPLSCPRDVPSVPGSLADPPYHAPIEIKSTVNFPIDYLNVFHSYDWES